MLFATVFYFNSLGNFALGVALSALLGPAEFGRYATVALAAITLATAVLDWLRFSALRFSGETKGRIRIASSLEAAYVGVIVLLVLGVGAMLLGGWTLGLTPSLLVLTPLLAIALNRVDFAGALFRSRDQERAFAALYSLQASLLFHPRRRDRLFHAQLRDDDRGARACQPRPGGRFGRIAAHARRGAEAGQPAKPDAVPALCESRSSPRS